MEVFTETGRCHVHIQHQVGVVRHHIPVDNVAIYIAVTHFRLLAMQPADAQLVCGASDVQFQGLNFFRHQHMSSLFDNELKAGYQAQCFL